MSLHRFAIATAVATFLLLLVGGTVNPTGSSLACPDWPLCFGSLFPAMKDGVEYEHTHRLVATLVGLMTTILALWIWRSRETDAGLKRLGFLALGLVIAQGVLGGVTVLLKLPMLVSVSHLALSMIFFLLLLYLSRRLSPRAEQARPAGPRGLVRVALAGVYLQILLGALVRHTRSGRACHDDWLLCAGQLWPEFHPGQLQMVHRLVGLVVVALVVAAAVSVLRGSRAEGRPAVRAAAITAPLIALAQVVLGALLVRSGIGLVEAVAHTGVAALLLAALYHVYLGLGPEPARAASA
jgi:heme A synthase